MRYQVEFHEKSQRLDVGFREQTQRFDPKFRGMVTIHGKDGVTFVPSVSPDGVISWQNDKDMPNPEPVNIKGNPGYTPQKGIDYFDGKDGYTPVKGKDYFDGKDGHTPVVGDDYFTVADKAEMVSAVIAALPVYSGEVESV